MIEDWKQKRAAVKAIRQARSYVVLTEGSAVAGIREMSVDRIMILAELKGQAAVLAAKMNDREIEMADSMVDTIRTKLLQSEEEKNDE